VGKIDSRIIGNRNAGGHAKTDGYPAGVSVAQRLWLKTEVGGRETIKCEID